MVQCTCLNTIITAAMATKKAAILPMIAPVSTPVTAVGIHIEFSITLPIESLEANINVNLPVKDSGTMDTLAGPNPAMVPALTDRRK